MAGTAKTHGRLVTDAPDVWTVYMGGTVDGSMTRSPVGYSAWYQGPQPMRYVRIENVGDQPVRNPWVLVNGKRNWRSIEDVVAEVVRPGMSDEEKALRLWWFQVNHRFHATTDDEEDNDEIKVLNVYGYTLCGNDAEVLGHLFQAAGLKVRAGHPTGHCTTEVFWDGRWHLLDGDENIIVLLRDNHTLAGEEDIVRDHDLMKRTHTYGILSRDSRRTDEFSASLYTYEGERKPGRGFHTKHRMHFTLLPGEALVWRWQSLGRFRGRAHLEEGWGKQAVARVANGELVFSPDLRSPGARSTVRSRGCAFASTAPVLRVAHAAHEGVAEWDLDCPYPFVGGDLVGQASGEGTVSAALVLAGQEHVVGHYQVKGCRRISESLDPLFPWNTPAHYRTTLRLRMTGTAGWDRVTLRLWLQMAPLSLPELELGENTIKYVDDSPTRKVKVTFAWTELSFTRPPKPPAAPIFPADGATITGTNICFRWQPAEDPDGDRIVDYHFQLSERPDMAWPLSPNFHKLISNTDDKGKAQYTLPYEGLLAPDTTYYWRVRARDEKGVWGPWSRTWSFRCRCPDTPQELTCVVDREKRTVALRWKPGPRGTRPVKYRVYGSNEKGFTVSDVPYKILWTNMGGEEFREMPSNFLAETTATEIVVAGPGVSGPAANCAYYRVVAVDEAGARSTPSDYIELPRPFIYTLPPRAEPGREFSYQPGCIFSLGDLRCRPIRNADGSWSYYNAKFWDVEKVLWKKIAGPDWLTIDENHGTVSGTVPEQLAPAKVVIEAQIPGRGSDYQEWTIE
ncbi:MAG: hypothetical protein H5T86_03255 [Armatimonadetes bacterium]|nr:hypothetical protein [Armatimonadota bacterium]